MIHQLVSDHSIVTKNAWLFLMVLWVGLQCVIVEFPGLTHFYIEIKHLCILIHIRIKGEAGRILHVYKPFSILTDRFKAYL